MKHKHKHFEIILLIILLISLLLFSCSESKSDKIQDIVPNINLISGKETSVVISDLFYSENYNAVFDNNKNLDVSYDSEAKLLSLKAHDNFEGIELIKFNLDDNFYHFPVTIKKEKFYTFSFKPSKKYEKINLFGSFNGWNREDIPMTDDNNDGVYEIKVGLEPGVYQYKFFGDGVEIVDPVNPNKVPNGFGDFNSIRTISNEDDITPYLFVNSFSADNINAIFSFVYQPGKAVSEISSSNVISLLNNIAVTENQININDNIITITIPKNELDEKKILRVAVTNDGEATNFQYVILFNGTPADNDTQFTWYDGIIYSLMIDRFNDGDTLLNKPVKHDSLLAKANYMGGDLKGILDKLNEGYFDSLGINTIWISPVYDNPDEAFREYPEPHRWYSGYHGYWPIDPRRVEEHFGNMNILKEFINVAHKHNIKILLDFVSNHVHEQHPFYQENPNWFGQLELPDGSLNIRYWDKYRLTTWFEPYLPSFDFLGSQEALDSMVQNAAWWLNETGADGFRHDAVKHVPNEFWRALTKKLKEDIEIPRGKTLYQVGETFGSYDLICSYVNNGQLSAQFNFNLYEVAFRAFINKENSFDALDNEMHKTFSVYGPLHLMGNIMDSHDKNRFMAYADGDLDVSQWSAAEVGWNNPPKVDDPENYKKLILYMAYMNSIPGLPIVYYGSEFGMTGASDPDNRRMMRFDEDLSKYEKSTLTGVTKTVKLRRAHPALRYGDFYTLLAVENIYAYVRSDMNERILVVLNKSDKHEKIEIELPNIFNCNKLVDLTNSAEITVLDNFAKIEISGYGWKMFEIK